MICKLHTQVYSVNMCVVPGPTSQDTVIKRVYVSPGFECAILHIMQKGNHFAIPVMSLKNESNIREQLAI
jgi:hypothetical protein